MGEGKACLYNTQIESLPRSARTEGQMSPKSCPDPVVVQVAFDGDDNS